MSDENFTNQPENRIPETTEGIEPIGKFEAVTGVITDPSDTFERIASFKPAIYWALPVIIFIIANLIASFLFLSDIDLYNSVMDKQRKNLEEKFDESVKEGKMSQEEKAIARETAEKFMNPKSPFAIGITVASSVIGPFFMMVLLSVIYLLAIKVLKGDNNFTNILNVVGLSFVIGAIGKILDTVLSIIMGTVNSVSLGLVLSEASVGSTLHGLIMRVDVFSIWSLIVISIGLVIVGKLKSKAIYFVVFGIWLLWIVVASFLLPS